MEIGVLVVGGGPAGLAAATRLYKKGVHNILIAEREKQLGEILRQYIHDGFGPTRSKTTLSGPEHTRRFIDEVEESEIPYITGAIVLEVTEDRTVTAATYQKLKVWRARSVILTMGCRERTRDTLGTPGGWPVGVLTAGVVQAYVNLCNVMPAKEVVTLESGNIGMIMTRRPMPEGAHVQTVFETRPYPSGLPRSVEQYLDNCGILLYLSHTVTVVHGGSRLTSVTVSRVDERLRLIPETEKEYKCDALILSADPIPENEPSLDTGVTLDGKIKGAAVDKHFQTDVEGIFAAGDVLHVHDLVDLVPTKAENLANSAMEYIQNGCLTPCPIEIEADNHINHTVPQKVSGTRDFKLSLRVSSPLKECSIEVGQGGVLMALKKMKKATLAEMTELTVKADELVPPSQLEVSAEC